MSPRNPSTCRVERCVGGNARRAFARSPLSGVNYFFYLTTIISPYQRQLLFDSLGGGAERPSSGEGAEPFWPAAPRLLRLSLSSAICKIVWAAKAGKADHHTFFFS
jgi:hypothetical protein